MIWFVLLLSGLFGDFARGEDCNIRKYPDGPVCVCNATYCDTVPSLNVPSGQYQIYTSSSSKLGFYSKLGSFTSDVTVATNRIKVNQSSKYQTIIGFGGAFTDSTGINIKLLPAEAQDKLLESYFSESGIGYNLCRVAIGGTDFSTRGYSYDDIVNDTTLEHFALQPEDINYKIPFIQRANALTSNKLNLFASAWSAPIWMKTNDDWAGIGLLQEQYYQLWADYTMKFFDAYEKNNITFWGVTTQNEPMLGSLPLFFNEINAMGWTPEQMNKWIGENLGPTLRSSTHKDIKIILHDDARLSLGSLEPLLNNNVTMSYADGVGVHWYANFLIPASILATIKSDIKDVFILATEASNGYFAVYGIERPVEKGSWARGAKYIEDILENLEYGVSGWIDWNMVLDETGGPTYISNFLDSPIIVNETLQEFYKQPMFYALGHFSKFVPPGSVRLQTSLAESATSSGVQAMAFLRPDNLTAIVIYNGGTSGMTIEIENAHSQTASLKIESESISTVLYDYNFKYNGALSTSTINFIYLILSFALISIIT